jgi:hypothetical protein
VLWDRVKGPLLALLGAADPRARYAGVFGATVVAVSGMTADVRLDDPSVPGMSALSLQVGLPAATVDFAAGAHVRVAFENRDPSRAFIIGWAPGASASRVSLPAGKVELGGENLQITQGTVNGEGVDPFTGLPYWMLGSSSKTVLAKG